MDNRGLWNYDDFQEEPIGPWMEKEPRIEQMARVCLKSQQEVRLRHKKILGSTPNLNLCIKVAAEIEKYAPQRRLRLMKNDSYADMPRYVKQSLPERLQTQPSQMLANPYPTYLRNWNRSVNRSLNRSRSTTNRNSLEIKTAIIIVPARRAIKRTQHQSALVDQDNYIFPFFKKPKLKKKSAKKELVLGADKCMYY